MTANWQMFRTAGERALNEGRLDDAETNWLLALAEADYYPSDDPRRATTLEGLAEAYFRQGKHNEAEDCCRQVLSIYESALGPEHPDVGVTANNLAMLLHSQKRYADAEPLYKKALSIRKKALGDNHPDVMRLLESYADLLMKTHREAEAVSIKDMIKGITTGRWNRSGNYQTMPATQAAAVNAAVAGGAVVRPGEIGEVTGPMPALTELQAVTGPHPTHRGDVKIARGTGNGIPAMAPVSNNTSSQVASAPQAVSAPPAMNMPAMNANAAPSSVATVAPPAPPIPAPVAPPVQVQPARPMHAPSPSVPAAPAPAAQPAVATATRPTGELNLGAPQSSASLGAASTASAVPAQANAARAGQHPAQSSPPLKPTTANDGPLWMRQWNAYKDFAEEATRRNLLDLATKQWTEALIEAESSGEANPRLAYTLDNLADNLCRLGRFDEAEATLNRCIRMKTDAIGENHVTVALSISNLARLHYAQKNYSQAETYLYDVIRIYENVFGEEHPETASALYNLALIYHQQNQFDQAEPVYKRCWNVRKRVLGEEHADTVKVRDNYSKILAIKQQRAVEEEKQRVAAAAAPVTPLTSTPAKPYVFQSAAEQQITGSWRVLELPQDMQLGANKDEN